MDELIEAFSVKGINKSPSIFDIDKLSWMNGEYIKAMSDEEFARECTPWLDKSSVKGKYDYTKLFKILKTRVMHFDEVPALVDFLPELPDYDIELYSHKKMKTDPEAALRSLTAAREALGALTDWSETALHDALIGLAQKMQIKNGQMLWPVRIALTGLASTPGGAIEIADILGRQESLARIDIGISKLTL